MFGLTFLFRTGRSAAVKVFEDQAK